MLVYIFLLRGLHYVAFGVVLAVFIVGNADAAVVYYRVSEKKGTPLVVEKSKKSVTAPLPLKNGLPPKKVSPLKKVSQPQKTTVSAPAKKNQQTPKKQTNTSPKTTLKTAKTAPTTPSASVVKVSYNTKDVEKKSVSEVVNQKVIDPIFQREEEERKAARQATIDLLHRRWELEKEAADALVSKLTQNPSDQSYREKLRTEQKIQELYDQFSKLQTQVDFLETDIRNLGQGTDSKEIGTPTKSLSLQKTKFLLLRQQEDVLQQIELKENYITQLIELAKRDYEFTKRLHDSYTEKHNQTQQHIKTLQDELSALSKNKT